MPNEVQKVAPISGAEGREYIDAHVWIPRYMAKLAEYGVVPTNREQAVALIRAGQKARVLMVQDSIKAASQGNTLLDNLEKELDKELGETPTAPRPDPQLLKTAEELVKDPKVLQAATAALQDFVEA